MDLFLQTASENALTVSALTELIRKQLEGKFSDVWVCGEVSNLRHQGSGHIYFSLKDANSQLSCVLFRRDAERQTVLPENGMECILCGNLSVYAPRGSYQLVARLVIESGAGRLQAEFERLKRLLAAEGVFARENKRALPILPLRIALITSPTGAALQDFLRILKRREFGGQVTVFPARVQGAEAPAELLCGLEQAQRGDFDVIVLTRGGGSIEDLWAFNDPNLARAVAASRIPTLSAVGHEIDHVLTDYAADVRAETPSGAAELISSRVQQMRERIIRAGECLQRARTTIVNEAKAQLKFCEAEFKNIHPRNQLEKIAMRVDEFEQNLSRCVWDELAMARKRITDCVMPLEQLTPRNRVQLMRERLQERTLQLNRCRMRYLAERKKQLDQIECRLQNNGVDATLKRGYALLTDDAGQLLAKRAQIMTSPNRILRARLQDGSVRLKLDKDPLLEQDSPNHAKPDKFN
jgi:exodeoxyribonuclease VII large subunit